ncbi:hypothetical protein GS921_15510 [Rhodococcus hoagii]|nr:hypothetical protein [Prescottella equi]
MAPIFEAMGGPRVAASFGNKPGTVKLYDTSTPEGIDELYSAAECTAEMRQSSFLNLGNWERVGKNDRGNVTLSEATAVPADDWYVCWADIDVVKGKINWSLLTTLTERGAAVFRSPSGGKNVHVWWFFDEPMTMSEVKARNRRIKHALGADDKDNPVNFLRVPYAPSFKDKHAGRTLTVKSFDDEPWSPDEFDDLLVSQGFKAPERDCRAYKRTNAPIDAEDYDWASLPRPVRTAFRKHTGDTSEDLWELWRVCAENDVPKGMALSLTYDHETGSGKYDEASLFSQIHKAYAAGGLGGVAPEHGALAAYAGTHTLDDLWDHSAVTRHILTSARGQIVGPMTLFLSLMMEALMRVPPHIVLPAAVGGHASLNMQIGLMAESGGSKGASASVVDMCMNFDRDSYSVGIGTGEGITSQYGEWVKESVSWKRTAVLFTAAEISTIEALANRVGSTLIADLTKAWSGEPLGYANRRKETSIQLKSHRYRLGFITGVQPVKAHILLKHVGQGFVERFLFARGDDPDADDSYTTPRSIDWPGNRALDSMIDEIPEDEFDLDTKQKIDNLVQITIPGHVHTAIRKHQVYKRRGGTINALDSHAMLLRLKVAAGIAALHGQFKEITDTDWDLAGAIMRHHRETRDHTLAVLSKESAKANEAKAVAAGRYAAKSEQVAETLRLQATKDLIVDKLKGAMGPVAGNKLKKTLTIGKRQLFEPALAELVGEGTVIDIPAKQNGHVYELATD